jgi:PAS domain S-box-containing protein
MTDQTSPFGFARNFLILTGVLAVLYLARLYSYLLFHTLVEMFSIVVACVIFVIAWNSRRIMANNYFLFIGIAFFFVGAVDFLHTLAYKGMGLFAGFDANLPTQLWVVARYLQSISLLVAPLFLGRKLKAGCAIAGFLAATALLLAAVLGGVFPDCFVEGKGLTPFKKGSEYLFALLLTGSLVFMRNRMKSFDRDAGRLISTAITVFIASELAFTLYTDVYGISNMVGHFLKFAGFYLIYKALIEAALTRPYDLLFRDLKQSEARYRALFEKMISGIAYHRIILDGNGKPADYLFLEVNSAFERLTGLQGRDIVGKRVTEALPGIENDPADWIGIYGRVALSGEEITFEQYSEPLNKWFSISAYSPQKGYFVAVFEDITGRKRAEDQLRRAKDELEQRVTERTIELATTVETLLEEITEREKAEEALRLETVERIRAIESLREKDQMMLQQSRMAALGEMLGNIAHQWRQPLNALGLTVQELGLSYECGQFSKEHLDASIDKSMAIVTHLSQTIDDFRNFSKPDKEKSHFAVNPAVVRTVALIEESFREQHIGIEVVTSGDPHITGYPKEYAQVVLNILVNARDALLERQKSKARVTVSSWTEEGRAVVTITDNAGGIKEEIMGRIFDPYFTTKDLGKGSGIGLYQAKTIIEKNMGGLLTARNTGEGAEFRIEV